MVPSTMVASGVTSKPEGEDVAPQLAKARTPKGWHAKAIRVRTGGAHRGASQLRQFLTGAFKSAIDKAPQFQVKSIKDLSHTEYMEHWKRFADRSERAASKLSTAFRGLNAKQKQEVLEALERDAHLR